jgi:hypothetical protein
MSSPENTQKSKSDHWSKKGDGDPVIQRELLLMHLMFILMNTSLLVYGTQFPSRTIAMWEVKSKLNF